jgi:type IV pilus assembly protein PilM
MFSMFRKPLKAGLDVGRDTLKYVLLDEDRGIIHYARKEKLIPKREGKDHILKGEELRESLKAFLANCQKDCSNYSNIVNTAIQGEGTICQYIDLPKLGKKELDVAVPCQAMKYIPFPMDTVNFSYLTVPSIKKEDDKTGIFFIAAQKKLVEDMKNLLEQSDLQIEGMEIPALSLVRVWAKNRNMPKDNFYALVHTGFRLTHVIVLKDHYPYYCRDVSIAGRDFTYAIQMNEQISWEEAENYKLSYDATQKDVFMEPFMIKWLDDVKKSLGFFNKQFRSQSISINQIFFSGGTSMMKGLARRLSEHINIPVISAQWDRVKIDSKFTQTLEPARFSLSVGLALKK